MGQSDEKYVVVYDEYGTPYLARPMSEKRRRRVFWLIVLGLLMPVIWPSLLFLGGLVGAVTFSLVRDAFF